MIDQNHPNNQLPNELHSVFSELEIFKHLRRTGITKTFGFSCSYLFQLVFCLIFQHKNWFSLLDSKKADRYPAKDAVYRFLNQPTFNLAAIPSVVQRFNHPEGRSSDRSLAAESVHRR